MKRIRRRPRSLPSRRPLRIPPRVRIPGGVRPRRWGSRRAGLPHRGRRQHFFRERRRQSGDVPHVPRHRVAIHAPLARGDRTAPSPSSSRRCCDPRPPPGGRRGGLRADGFEAVAIHAPLAGGDGGRCNRLRQRRIGWRRREPQPGVSSKKADFRPSSPKRREPNQQSRAANLPGVAWSLQVRDAAIR